MLYLRITINIQVPHLKSFLDILGGVPPRAGFLSPVSINETTQSHSSCQSEHYCVETQPGKVNANLLSIILPVEKKCTKIKQLFYFKQQRLYCFLRKLNSIDKDRGEQIKCVPV